MTIASSFPRYYELLSGKAPYPIFRVSSGGHFDRWDHRSRRWIRVTNRVARDGLSHAIEGGDAVPTSVR
jgi:hypothetical protein